MDGRGGGSPQAGGGAEDGPATRRIADPRQ